MVAWGLCKVPSEIRSCMHSQSLSSTQAIHQFASHQQGLRQPKHWSTRKVASSLFLANMSALQPCLCNRSLNKPQLVQHVQCDMFCSIYVDLAMVLQSLTCKKAIGPYTNDWCCKTCNAPCFATSLLQCLQVSRSSPPSICTAVT